MRPQHSDLVIWINPYLRSGLYEALLGNKLLYVTDVQNFIKIHPQLYELSSSMINTLADPAI